MFKIEDIIAGDFSAYEGETKDFIIAYSELLRQRLKDELIKDRAEKIMKNIENGNDTFVGVLSELLDKGNKGYDAMTTRALLDIYLEKKGPEDFAELLKSINNEL